MTKMEFDGQYAVFEIGFIFDDPRLDELTPAQRWVYVTLWCLAVKLRRERLTPKLIPNRNKTIQRLARVDSRVVNNSVTRLQQLCLINVDTDGTITVCGVKKKHPKLRWKDDHERSNIDPHSHHIHKTYNIEHKHKHKQEDSLRKESDETSKSEKSKTRKKNEVLDEIVKALLFYPVFEKADKQEVYKFAGKVQKEIGKLTSDVSNILKFMLSKKSGNLQEAKSITEFYRYFNAFWSNPDNRGYIISQAHKENSGNIQVNNTSPSKLSDVLNSIQNRSP